MKKLWTLAITTLLPLKLIADQPITNMMPRWNNGYGFQFIQEYRHNTDLLLGKQKIGNGLSEEAHIINIEGVYTWKRWIRLTAKLPYTLHAKRELLDSQGNTFTQTTQGIGDLTLALPLKKYFNLDGRSGSWTIAPQLRIPLTGKSAYEIGDGEWGGGLSLGYETETAQWFFGTSTTAWVFDNHEPFEISASLDLGRNIAALGSSGQITWETDFTWEDNGSRKIKAGPAIYWKLNDTIHLRADWKHHFYEKKTILDHGNGDTLKLTLGFVF